MCNIELIVSLVLFCKPIPVAYETLRSQPYKVSWGLSNKIPEK